MKIAGIDPALRNTGVAIGELDVANSSLIITELYVIQTAPMDDTWQAEDMLRRCKEIYKHTLEYTKDCQIIFAELPTGGSNNQTAFALGAGLTAALIGLQQPLITVSPHDVKKTVLSEHPAKDRNKAAMVSWAMNKHPEAPWPTYPYQGKFNPVENFNYLEHLADAIAAIYAGINKVKEKNGKADC